MQVITCYECQRTFEKKCFFKDKTKYITICKNCIYKEVGKDLVKAIPYLDLYEIPVFPDKWYELIDKFPNDISPFGKYYSYCKLFSFQNMNFTDSFNEHFCEITSKKEIKRLKKEYIKFLKRKIKLKE